jgi:pimeloyl-ACP methyl ester carboxylesterase
MTGVMDDSSYFSKLPQRDREIMMANTTELGGIVFGKNIFSPIACDDLKKIKVPVLLLNGERSPLIFSSVISELDHCLSNREIAKLPNSSHGLEYDNPDEFNKIVLGFIKKH